MFTFTFKRILQAIPVLFIVATLTFFMIRLAPGGPFSTDKNVSPEIMANINKHYGLDKPVLQQYYDYMISLLTGDLGPSYKYSNRNVNEIIAQTFPVSLELGLMAMLFAVIIGVIAGVTAAIKPNSLRDYVSMSFVMIGICVPAFVLGPILIWFFAIKLEWFNVAGWNTIGDCILPTITLGAIYAANIARLSRGGMLEILTRDFIRTARAKGISEKWVIIKHALRGGLMSVISYIGPAIAGVITGSFVVETIFQIPGLGRIFVQAAFNRDYTLIVGTVIFYALLIVVLNVVVDILQILLDPRRSFND
jgi:oligopeptide transport system permease protein